MKLDEFLKNLHYYPDKIRPQDWVVNWEDAPLPYKLYRGLPLFQLSLEIPLSLKQKRMTSNPDIHDIGHFLWFTFGLTQLSQTLNGTEPTDAPPRRRRFIPSGGGLYPNELYIYLKLEDLPMGIYHYDIAHHQLILLREGNFDRYLSRALGNRCDISSSFGTVFVSTVFWKNFFKYHNFSYRLQGLDTGFVIGQLLNVGKQFGFEIGVYYQFLDRAINHLLGISEKDESVYAVIPLSTDSTMEWFSTNNGEKPTSVAQLCCELTSLENNIFNRSKEIREYPLLVKINEACMMDSIYPYSQTERVNTKELDRPLIFLSFEDKLVYDLSAASRNRYSPGMDFVLEQIVKMNYRSFYILHSQHFLIEMILIKAFKKILFVSHYIFIYTTLKEFQMELSTMIVQFML